MNILWDLYVAGESYSYDRGNLSEIKGAFGENGYTPPEPTDNDYKTQIVISKDIKSELSSGMNNFVLKSDYTISESIPDEPGAEDFISYKYSGRVIAFLNIIGNLATKENS